MFSISSKPVLICLFLTFEISVQPLLYRSWILVIELVSEPNCPDNTVNLHWVMGFQYTLGYSEGSFKCALPVDHRAKNSSL